MNLLRSNLLGAVTLISPKNDKYFREDYRCSGRRLKGRFAIFSRKSISFAKACEEICFFDAT